MKTLKYIGIGLLGVILLLVIISFFLPRKLHVERSITINAKPEIVFGLVNDLKEWDKWSPWHKMDTNMKLTFSEVSEGTNAWYSWESTSMGNGKLSIVESVPYELIKTDLQFGDMTPSHADYIFTQTENGEVKVVWTLDSDVGMNPLYKWMCVIMKGYMEQDYAKGLKNLKAVAEAIPEKVTIAGFDFEERHIDAITVAGIRSKENVSELTSSKFAGWYELIGKTVVKVGLQITGAPLSIYYTYENDISDMEAAVPVNKTAKNDGQVKFHELPAVKAIVVKYYGDYANTEVVYNEAYAYIEKQGLKNAGAPREVYITDPGTEKDTSKWLTEIVFPVE